MAMDPSSEVSHVNPLFSLLATEKDRDCCSFYVKIGACRHGEKCSRAHTFPSRSRTILLKNFYPNAGRAQEKWSTNDQVDFDEFYREVFEEISDKYGRIDDMNVCDNVGEHMFGNVYVKFRHEESADRAVSDLNSRWFNGRPIHCELSPVVDFRDACCRQYEIGECSRGGFCNFMHLKKVSKNIRRKLKKRTIRCKSRSSKRKCVEEKRTENCDSSLPRTYLDSLSPETSSCSDSESEGVYDDGSSTPLAFRSDRYPSDISECESEPDPEIEALKRKIRRQRWDELKWRLQYRSRWDEDRERNFIFSLL
ncbi:hypothetical protein AB6A40_005613 [Gnathostoma spinigerum]|uniref:Uncharacterized protein n=1 Tax=Gnathostoma spinigerum TaxID=75299 RepID=A0ABD6ENK6_9BILA